MAACQRGSKKSKDCSFPLGSWKKVSMNKWKVERPNKFLIKKACYTSLPQYLCQTPESNSIHFSIENSAKMVEIFPIINFFV
jgi:hypothetical protein